MRVMCGVASDLALIRRVREVAAGDKEWGIVLTIPVLKFVLRCPDFVLIFFSASFSSNAII